MDVNKVKKSEVGFVRKRLGTKAHCFINSSPPFSSMKKKITFNEIIPIRETKRFFKTPKVRGALLLFFIYSFGFGLFISTFALFAEKQLQINAQEVGFYMAWLGILRVVFQSFFID